MYTINVVRYLSNLYRRPCVHRQKFIIIITLGRLGMSRSKYGNCFHKYTFRFIRCNQIMQQLLTYGNWSSLQSISWCIISHYWQVCYSSDMACRRNTPLDNCYSSCSTHPLTASTNAKFKQEVLSLPSCMISHSILMDLVKEE